MDDTPFFSCETTLQLGLSHHQRGDFAAAEDLYRQILRDEPNQPNTLHFLGVLYIQTDRCGMALEYIARAVQLQPAVADYHGNLGEAFRRLGRFPEAIASLQTALRLNPLFVDAMNNLGNAFSAMGHPDEAANHYRAAIALQPNAFLPRYNLAVTLADARRPLEAEAAYLAAIDLNPSCAEAYDGLGTVLRESGRVDDAIRAHEKALQFNPDDVGALLNLANTHKDAGRIESAVQLLRRALAIQPGGVVWSNLIYTLHFLPDGHEQVLAEQARWASHHEAMSPKRFYIPRPGERLRIGYVSPDFCNHVIGRNLLPLFRHRDRDHFEVICYSDVATPDALTMEFRTLCDSWRPVKGLSDESLASMIFADRIDVLVDLTQHLAGNRLGMFSLKPAPVQIGFAGYPASTGLATIDARLSDPYLDPPACPDATDPVIHLPHSFWCYEPMENAQPVSPLPALKSGRITFGCLHNFCKINPSVVQLWISVLSAVPHSQMIVLAPAGRHRSATAAQFEAGGIDPERLLFVSPQPHREYMAIYEQIDLALDTLPYNGHSTSLDALWMGVPVITLVGKTSLGRAGWSLLSNLHRCGWAAHDPFQFVRAATDLASDIEGLAAIRATLRSEMAQSALMDGQSFARGIETAFRNRWNIWRATQSSP